ncbi:MAG: hypothetical protein AB7P02_26745 [Alphaproteobacteria bacterium]
MTQDEEDYVSPYLQRPTRSYAEYLREQAERERRHRTEIGPVPANDNEPASPSADNDNESPADGASDP